jgi:hypothetical protein
VVARYINQMKVDTKPLAVERGPKGDPKSFGAFLGSFNNPPTNSQVRLLSQWDVLVLDPLQENVPDALSACHPSSSHVLGRLDVHTLAGTDGNINSDDTIRTLGTISQHLNQYFSAPFTGVLLADICSNLQPVVVNEVTKYINDLGLDVWLELAPPAYLTQREAREINMKFIRGIIYRNGTVRPDGEQQNYFQMTEMRTAMRAVAAQRVVHGPPQIMWETIDDGMEMQYAVVQRSFTWCTYSSALNWVGYSAALYDADTALVQTVTKKPLGALMWLKGDDIMKSHDSFRSNLQVSEHPVLLFILSRVKSDIKK